MKNSEFLTAEELAERLRVQPNTVREWSRKRKIPVVRVSRKVVRFDWGAVLDALIRDVDTAERPEDLISILVAAKRAGNRQLESKARHRLEVEFGVTLSFACELDNKGGA